ncbi:Sodium/alanine symporter AgcS [Neochlamydia sp. EPS4]|nr:Sodium/alanine symporter AgcS [Neochlamydia sp. EPS4]
MLFLPQTKDFLMENVDIFLSNFKNAIWSAPLLIFLIGTGAYLTIILKGVQFRYLGYAIKQVFARTRQNSQGDISPFEALMTSLAGAIGTGAIVGVATGLAVGGLGSIFWMWITAFVGMATKYAESILAVKYRIKDDRGEMMGGPMQYIEKGLGWKWMALLFALLGALAAITTGNLVQVNAITEAIQHLKAVDPFWTGIVLAGITGLVIIGGVKSIGHVAGVLVPIMALFYIIGGLIVITFHFDKIPHAFGLIIKTAFTGQGATGGFVGATLMMAIQSGVSRSVFSNEAGLGISSIAAAAAKTDSPGRQGMITMTGALISTVIVCTVTGLVLAVTQVQGAINDSGEVLNGAAMAFAAFESTIPGGSYIVSIGLILFAFSTVLAWAYYGEKCFEYIFGINSVNVYRILFTLIIIPSAVTKMEIAWYLADITNGLMVIPNLISLIGLSAVVVAENERFLALVQKERLALQKTFESKQ